jgi:NAD-dependent dihydropyrimidine dehydrogenase PreA subunit
LIPEGAALKTLTLYYSQTGNTKKIAEAIYSGMSQVADECKIATINDVDVRTLRDYDLVGFGAPAIGAEPDIMKRYVLSVPRAHGEHVFAFNTHGALPREYFPIATRRLRERGLTVIGYKGWFASVQIQCFPVPYYTDGHPDEIDLKEAEEFGKEMVERSRRISQGETSLIPELPPLAPEKPYALPHGQHKSIHGNIKYNPEKCLYPKCHICMDNCPERYIDLSANPRRYGSDFNECTINECCMCELYCPTGAAYIEDEDLKYGLEFLHDHSDFFQKTLEEEEAAGNFRRLVPLNKIGWDTPFYEVHAKRPRLKQHKKAK